MIPYLASSSLYARWLLHRIGGKTDAEAWSLAIRDLDVAPRNLARTKIHGGGRQPPLILSIPVLGGASSIKKKLPDSLAISMHGRWTALHTGALEAAYSATAYFPHLMPEIEPLFREVAEGMPLENFNSNLHLEILKFLDFDSILPSLRDKVIITADSRASFPSSWRRPCPSGGHPSHTGFPATGNFSNISNASNLSDMSFIAELFRNGRSAILTLLTSLTMILILTLPAAAEKNNTPEPLSPEMKVRVYEGFQRFVDEYGDTVRMTYIRELIVYPPLKFKNKKEEEFYWRTVRDVRKTLPYAKLCYATLCETYEYVQSIPDPKKREAHLKRLEKDIFERYKPVIKSMTKRQGKILLKLINRETDQSSYHIVKAFLGSFRAGFWQTFGKFFGMNLKAGFNPKKNKEDAVIDRVATLIEQGSL